MKKIKSIITIMLMIVILNACSDGTEHPNSTIETDQLLMTTSHPTIEQCTYTEKNVEALHFVYKQFSCENTESYAELGDYILASIRSEGYRFLDQELDMESWEFEFDYEFIEEEQYLVTYDIEGDGLGDYEQEELPPTLLKLAEDQHQHENLWNLFTGIIPQEAREEIIYFTIFAHDETTGFVDAYVSDDEAELDWLFALNLLNIEPPEKKINVILHELAHTFTLDDDQLDISISEEDCDSIYVMYGCSKQDSMVQTFYNGFWQDHYEFVNSMNQDEEKVYDYYMQHQDEFVHEYAATSVSEDIAETFAYFVLEPKPDGDLVREQKILFFYTYPEFVALRTEILSRLQSLIANNQVL